MTDAMFQLAEALVQEGVAAAFGVSGSGPSLDLIGALDARGVPYFDTCHEASATLMAAEFGRQTNTFGFSVSIKGPGLANAVPGIVANAYENRVALSASEAYADNGSRAHKRLDHSAAAFAAKAYATLSDPADTTARLLRVARAEAPGPVHLDLADGAAERFEERAAQSPGEWPGSASQAAALLNASQRPVVIAGSLAIRAGWGDRLRRLRIPVFTTFAAKGLVDEIAPFSAGVYTGDGKDLAPEARLLADADAVVAFGLRPEEVVTPRPFACPVIAVDVASADQILDVLEEHESDEARVVSAVDACRRAISGHDWRPGSLFAELQHAVPTETCLALDTGAFCTAAEHVWLARAPLDVAASANGRFMGTSLPMAIGAALARRDRPVACVVGDGGFRPYVADLKVAIDLELPLLLVLVADGRYGSVAEPAGTARNVQSATTIRRPSWLRAIEALGCEAVLAEDLDAFVEAASGWNRSAPRFIEARFDPSTYTVGLERVR